MVRSFFYYERKIAESEASFSAGKNYAVSEKMVGGAN